jgi:hypothetical protein
MEETIAYKVVGKRNRFGSNMNIFLKEHHFGPMRFEMWKNENKALWKRLRRYFPQYIKGSIVKSVKGSPGIMCFETYEEAEKFTKLFWHITLNNCTIIKVKGIGEKTNVEEILAIRDKYDHETDLSKLIRRKEYITRIGYKIISYPKVEVLE